MLDARPGRTADEAAAEAGAALPDLRRRPARGRAALRRHLVRRAAGRSRRPTRPCAPSTSRCAPPSRTASGRSGDEPPRSSTAAATVAPRPTRRRQDLWRAAKGPVAVLRWCSSPVVLVALAAGGADTRPLDPRSPAPPAAGRVAELLRDQGVTRRPGGDDRPPCATPRAGDDAARRRPGPAGRRAGRDPASTPGPTWCVLSTVAPRALRARRRRASRRIPTSGHRAARCRRRAAAGAADAGADRVRRRRHRRSAARSAVLRRTTAGRRSCRGRSAAQLVTLLGIRFRLTNARLDDEGNAALALGLLGEHDRLVWYLPSPCDVPPQAQTSFYDLVPDGVWWGLAQLAIAVAAAGAVAGPPARPGGRRAAAGRGAGRRDGRGPGPALPAGRRAGPGRPRRCAQAVRARLVPRARPARGAPSRRPSSQRSPPAPARPAAEVGALLYGAAPADDASLVRLADASTTWRERYADRDVRGSVPDDRRRRDGAVRAAGGPPRPGQGRPRRPAAPCAPRSARPSSARTPPSPGWSSRCSAAATCCSRACPASRRRCSCARLAAALSLDTKRVQFTPDLMPGDVTGSLVYDARSSEFSFREGPVFTNLLLADEINRTPPKTQAALLEAMEERQVSVDGDGRGRCPTRSWSSPPRTRSSTRAPTRCPRPSSTGSCSS